MQGSFIWRKKHNSLSLGLSVSGTKNLNKLKCLYIIFSLFSVSCVSYVNQYCRFYGPALSRECNMVSLPLNKTNIPQYNDKVNCVRKKFVLIWLLGPNWLILKVLISTLWRRWYFYYKSAQTCSDFWKLCLHDITPEKGFLLTIYGERTRERSSSLRSGCVLLEMTQ